jgi:hypothetical protein
MRIRIPSFQELNPGYPKQDEVHNYPHINGRFATLADCEVVDDDGKPMTNLKSVNIHMACGEPIVVTIEQFDPCGEIKAVVVEGNIASDGRR